MGDSKLQEPEYEPQIIGLLLQGHPQKGSRNLEKRSPGSDALDLQTPGSLAASHGLDQYTCNMSGFHSARLRLCFLPPPVHTTWPFYRCSMAFAMGLAHKPADAKHTGPQLKASMPLVKP